MGFLDKARDMVSRNKDRISETVDKGADIADRRTGGKYTDKIGKGAEKAKDYVDRIDRPGAGGSPPGS